MRGVIVVVVLCVMLATSACRTCVLESIRADGILPDEIHASSDGHYDVSVKDNAIEYWIHGVGLLTHPECRWILRHEECKSSCCLFVNETTSAHVEAQFDGKELIWKKSEGRNLGRDQVTVRLR